MPPGAPNVDIRQGFKIRNTQYAIRRPKVHEPLRIAAYFAYSCVFYTKYAGPRFMKVYAELRIAAYSKALEKQRPNLKISNPCGSQWVGPATSERAFRPVYTTECRSLEMNSNQSPVTNHQLHRLQE